MQRLTDLRSILHYVPQFRDRIFVIAMDGEIVADANFANLLLDIALLRSLRIGVVLVHGAGERVENLAERLGVRLSNHDGLGITDAPTLEVARLAANQLSQELLVGLARMDLRAATSNAIVAHPAGIRQGIDQLWTGRVERIDAELLQALLQQDIIPVLPPLGCDGEQHTYRLNSDAVADAVARSLNAGKLLFLTACPGVVVTGQLQRQLTIEDAETLLAGPASELDANLCSKLHYAVRAARGGVPRIHILDGRVQEGLLAEVFSKEGIGTLVHANEYQAIRPATRKDSLAVYSMLAQGMDTEELLRRSREAIEDQIADFFVFEVDQLPVACGALHQFPKAGKAELACLFVRDGYENQGIGAKLIQYAVERTRAAGLTELFCLSTQASNYFIHKAGFQLGCPDDLPEERRATYEASQRRSKVLRKVFVTEGSKS